MIWRIKYSWQHWSCYNGPYFIHRVSWRKPVDVTSVQHPAQSRANITGSSGCSACADQARMFLQKEIPQPLQAAFPNVLLLLLMSFPPLYPTGISLVAACDLCLRSVAVHRCGASGSGFSSCCRWWKQLECRFVNMPGRQVNWYSLSATSRRTFLG